MFTDRTQAGRRLAERLISYKAKRPVVLGLPRGGVPVAAEVAKALNAPLDIIVVRKLGLPGHSEYAMGAIGEGDVRYVDWQVVSEFGVSASQLSRVVEREQAEMGRRVDRYRAHRPRVAVDGRTAIVVDDGIATGSTAVAAVRVARALGAESVVVATPVAPQDTVERLQRVADQVVVLETPSPFYAVGQAYLDFDQVGDEEVAQILGRSLVEHFDPAA
ncbi:MAG TPA: phosphoribosyltransferase family protein [Acidimicrobiia bacterium]